MVGQIANNELELMWKEKVIQRHLNVRPEENQVTIVYFYEHIPG
jgi:hypothetical protein